MGTEASDNLLKVMIPRATGASPCSAVYFSCETINFAVDNEH